MFNTKAFYYCYNLHKYIQIHSVLRIKFFARLHIFFTATKINSSLEGIDLMIVGNYFPREKGILMNE